MKINHLNKNKTDLKNINKMSQSIQKLKIKKNENKVIQYKHILKDKLNVHLQETKNITITPINTASTLTHKKRVKKAIKQQPQFLKEFEEMTKIYQHSKEIQNEEETSLLCLDETIDDCWGRKPRNIYSTLSKYSQKSNQLPSILEKEAQEQKEEDLLLQKSSVRKIEMSTATNYRKKNTKSMTDRYINQFDLKKGASRQKKISIDVLNLIKSRSTTKTIVSNKSGKRIIAKK